MPGLQYSPLSLLNKHTTLVCTFLTATLPAYIFNAHAEDLEDIPPMVTLQAGKHASMRISAYIQARVEYGDLIQGQDRSVQPSGFDLYFRRARIGFYGTALLPGLSYGLSLAGDESAQAEIYSSYDERGNVTLSDAYLRYALSDSLSLKFGKDKLPYSRIYLTSSAEQLFSERPYYTYALRDFLHAYTHSHLALNGKVQVGGLLAYSVAIGQAWRNGDRLQADTGPKVNGAAPEFVARIDWAPPGWQEGRRSDAHLGQGQHLSFGLYGSIQNGLRYQQGSVSATEDRQLQGIDMSYHQGSLTLQAEYNDWRTGGTSLTPTRLAQGVYAQGAYLLQDNMLEPAIRLERFKQKTGQDEGRTRVMTIGMNKYIQGHDLKFTLDWEQTWFDGAIDLLRPTDKDVRRVWRLTAQFVL